MRLRRRAIAGRADDSSECAGLRRRDRGATPGTRDRTSSGSRSSIDDRGAVRRSRDRSSRWARRRRTGAVVARQHGQRVRADLVRDVAVAPRCDRRRRSRGRPRPRAINDAAAPSAISVASMPSRSSSHIVRRAPCSSGRVSSTHTCGSRPASTRHGSRRARCRSRRTRACPCCSASSTAPSHERHAERATCIAAMPVRASAARRAPLPRRDDRARRPRSYAASACATPVARLTAVGRAAASRRHAARTCASCAACARRARRRTPGRAERGCAAHRERSDARR